MHKINIAFVIDYLNVGGTETQIYELVSNLSPQFNPIVICLKQKGQVALKLESQGIPVYFVHSTMELYSKILARGSQVWEMVKILKTHKIHIVQTYLLTANIFGTISGTIAKVPIICSSERGVTNTDVKNIPYKNTVFKWISKGSDAVFGNSKIVAQHLIENIKIPSVKITYIYNGINIQKYQYTGNYDLREELKIPKTTSLIGMIARLVPVKNHSLLLDAISTLSKENINFHVVLIGDGPQRSFIEAKAKKLGLASIIHFLGERTDIPQLLKCIDIVVMTSNYEGLPNSLMEAMAAKKPIIATIAGGIPEIVIHQKTGYLVEKNDASQFARQLSYLLRNPKKIIELGGNGCRHMTNYFSIESMVQKTEELYLTIAKNKKIFREKN